MFDINAMNDTTIQLRQRAGEIRREGEKLPYPTAGVDAALLEKAATLLEQAAGERPVEA